MKTVWIYIFLIFLACNVSNENLNQKNKSLNGLRNQIELYKIKPKQLVEIDGAIDENISITTGNLNIEFVRSEFQLERIIINSKNVIPYSKFQTCLVLK